jgi:hypothetical protein
VLLLGVASSDHIKDQTQRQGVRPGGIQRGVYTVAAAAYEDMTCVIAWIVDGDARA